LFDYAIVVLVSVASSEVIKSFINKPRPLFNLVGKEVEGSSFPSTHASVAFGIASYYLFISRLKFRNKPSQLIQCWALLVIAMIIAVLRVFLGAHFAIDVIAGMFVGITVAAVFSFVDIRLSKGIYKK